MKALLCIGLLALSGCVASADAQRDMQVGLDADIPRMDAGGPIRPPLMDAGRFPPVPGCDACLEVVAGQK
jgi:hypothetical protein